MLHVVIFSDNNREKNGNQVSIMKKKFDNKVQKIITLVVDAFGKKTVWRTEQTKRG